MKSIYTQLAYVFLACILFAEVGRGEDEPPKFVGLDQFIVAEGLKVTVWASSPLLNNPANMDIDRYGRIWISEGMNYRRSHLRPGGDRIVVLTDTDGDGAADKSHVFVQDPALITPLGVAVIGNKVVVSQPPDLIVYTDVDGDAVFNKDIDLREVLLTGWGGKNHDHSLHSVTVDPGGQWVFNTGNAGGHHVKGPDGTEYKIGSHYSGRQWSGKRSWDGHVYIGGAAFRMNPDGSALRVIGHNFRNSYEQIVTSFGDVFQNDNDDPPAARTTWLMEHGNLGFCSSDGLRKWSSDKRPGQSTQIAEWRQEDPGVIPAGDVYGGGAPTGIAYNEAEGLGEKYRGLLLTCEPARNTIFGYYPKPEGAGITLERFKFLTTNPEEKYAGVDFRRGPVDGIHLEFRPSDVAIGPDGAVYIADWFDQRVGGHGTRDRNGYGTVYRVAPEGFVPKIPKFDEATMDGAITALSSPAVNVRNIGFLALKSRGDKAVKEVSKLLKHENSHIGARATWLLPQLGKAGVKKVEKLLKARDEHTRITAFRALKRVDHEVVRHAGTLSKDKSAAVRREVALAMRDRPFEETKNVLVEISRRYDGRDRSYLEAIGIGAVNHEDALYQILRKEMGPTPADWSEAFAGLAWRLHPERAVHDMKIYIGSEKSNEEQKKRMLTGLAYIRSAAAARAMKELADSGPESQRTSARWWVQNRANNEWKAFQDVAAKPVDLVDSLVPEVLGTPTTLPALKEIMALKGDLARGKAAAARCYVCHEIDGQGADFGPNISMFGKANGREVIMTAILEPSAEISHGFDGIVVKTKDGKTLEGFVMVEGDPLVVKIFGGAQIAIARERIASSEKATRSLMVSGQNMGMSAQDIADVVAYLKSL